MTTTKQVTFERGEVLRLQQESLAREVWDLRVLVVGGGFPYVKMFFDAGIKGARNVEDADIICFTGGEDVDPALYGEKALSCTHFNTKRDEIESKIFTEALGLKKPMVGICRGSQLLNALNGGKLWQDVNNHAIAGTHQIVDMITGTEIQGMTSTHHQQMRPAADAEIIAVAQLSTRKKAESEEVSRAAPELDDVEVVWYPSTLCLCFQPHPEYGEGPCRNYFLKLLDNYIIPAT